MRRWAATLVFLAACAHAPPRGNVAASCRSDRDCAYGLVCRGKSPKAEPRSCVYETYGGCGKDADCFPGRACRQGECTVQCVTDAGCPKGRRCEVGECVATGGKNPCLLPGDCPLGEECLAGKCQEAPPVECAQDLDCGPLERCVAGHCR